MIYLVLQPIRTRKSEYRIGDKIETLNEAVVRPLIEQKIVKPLIDEKEATKLITVRSWLEKLSDSERKIFEERITKFDGALPKELAEVEVIKRIIQERIIPGKCDRCHRVKGCMLTMKQRELCQQTG